MNKSAGTPRISKAEYKAAIPDLRVRLVNAQYQLKDAGFAVMVLLAGRDRTGCEQVVDRLHEWMDARYLDTWFGSQPSQEEHERPLFWRFWRAMPPHGRVGIFTGGWVINLIAGRIKKKVAAEQYGRRVRYFNSLDQMLTANGTLLIKIWLDLPRKEMQRRLKNAERDPDFGRYVEDLDWDIYEHYEAAEPIVEEILADTGRDIPWLVIKGTDTRQRDLTVATTLLEAIEDRLDAAAPPPPPAAPQAAEIPDHLAKVDLAAILPYKKYRKTLDKLQVRLHDLSLQARHQKLAAVLAFEGWDAAGKGGVIRRITQAISARDCKVIPIAAPTDEELSRHYLWRFWRRLPRDGHMRIFDRSWYGRVLVERVEDLASDDEWRRAYAEINDFEAQILEHGTPVLKFWLHIDPDEQMRRFNAREETQYKKYKITEEDYRNRERWPAYAAAVNEMVERTSTDAAPWHLVAANDKRWARVQVLETLCDVLERYLQR